MRLLLRCYQQSPPPDTLTVVGDWLADAQKNDTFEHAGARDVLRCEDFVKTVASSVREALNRIPGVNSRSTVLMDGIPVPYAPYG